VPHRHVRLEPSFWAQFAGQIANNSLWALLVLGVLAPLLCCDETPGKERRAQALRNEASETLRLHIRDDAASLRARVEALDSLKRADSLDDEVAELREWLPLKLAIWRVASRGILALVLGLSIHAAWNKRKEPRARVEILDEQGKVRLRL
jgi:hypothetical protein